MWERGVCGMLEVAGGVTLEGRDEALMGEGRVKYGVGEGLVWYFGSDGEVWQKNKIGVMRRIERCCRWGENGDGVEDTEVVESRGRGGGRVFWK